MSRVEEFKIRAWVCTLCMIMEPSPRTRLSVEKEKQNKKNYENKEIKMSAPNLKCPPKR